MSRQRSAANIFKSVTKLVFRFFVSYHLMLSGNFKAWKVLVQGFYLGFVGALGMFLSLDLAPFDHPRHLKSELFSFVSPPLSTRVGICLVLVDWDTYNAMRVMKWRGVILAL